MSESVFGKAEDARRGEPDDGASERDRRNELDVYGVRESCEKGEEKEGGGLVHIESL